jgi:hypothetical protein
VHWWLVRASMMSARLLSLLEAGNKTLDWIRPAGLCSNKLCILDIVKKMLVKDN